LKAEITARRNSEQAVENWQGASWWRALFFCPVCILEQVMRLRAVELIGFAVLVVVATPAMAHCRVVGNAYLRGDYEGDCDEKTELAQGQGEAKGADSYVGRFVNGRPDGKGTYTWENGARLEGRFKGGKADGAGVYVSAKGVRYEGQFLNGKLGTLKPEDCPATPGPLNC
jgi:hypothetical protein